MSRGRKKANLKDGTRWGSLRKEILELCEHGEKKGLCEFLGITPSYLSKILHSDSQPRAEVALALLEWVSLKRFKGDFQRSQAPHDRNELKAIRKK